MPVTLYRHLRILQFNNQNLHVAKVQYIIKIFNVYTIFFYCFTNILYFKCLIGYILTL